MEKTVQQAEVNDGYDVLEQALIVSFQEESPLFTTNVKEGALWDVYLGMLPESRRQYYNCHCCRNFIERYGGLVRINQVYGYTESVWHGIAAKAPFFLPSVIRMVTIAESATVNGVFISSDKFFGTIENHDKKRNCTWSHLHAENPNVFVERVKSASQEMAEKLEDFKMLNHALRDYKKDVTEQALRVLRHPDAVERSEKALGIAEWFHALQGTTMNKRWWAVATAPPGFCHIRSTMISTLLDDIIAGYEFNDIRARWNMKMHPLQYQRPQAPPAEGTIRQAEQIVEKLGLAKSFERRYATLDDVLHFIWRPTEEQPVEKPTGGIFDHLSSVKRGVKPVELPATKMSFVKFLPILQRTKKLEILAPTHGGFYGLMTAVHADAPPIIQWDGLDVARNPVSWYFYHGGSPATQWSIVQGWNDVTAVFDAPNRWQKPLDSLGWHVFFAIKGAKEVGNSNSLALFPEILKSELHGVRSVIEAYSKSKNVKGAGDANGLALDDRHGVTLRADGETYIVEGYE